MDRYAQANGINGKAATMINEPSWQGRCAKCNKPVDIDDAYYCVCAKEGIVGHEDIAWCSADCMIDDHNEGEWGDYDKEAGEAKG